MIITNLSSMINDIIFLATIISFVAFFLALIVKEILPKKYEHTLRKWKAHAMVETGAIIWLGIILNIGYGIFAAVREEYFSIGFTLIIVMSVQLIYEKSFRKRNPHRWFVLLRNSIFGGVMLMILSFLFMEEKYLYQNTLSEIANTTLMVMILVDILIKSKYYRFRDE